MVSHYYKNPPLISHFCTYPESLVHDLSIEINGSFQEDLKNLQDEDVLPKDFSAYILAKLDAPSPDWMIVSYVPDNAKVRDKVGFIYP